MKFKVWVEVFTVRQFTEEIIEIPDKEWDAMTPDGRKELMQGVYEDTLSQIANGGWEEIEEN